MAAAVDGAIIRGPAHEKTNYKYSFELQRVDEVLQVLAPNTDIRELKIEAAMAELSPVSVRGNVCPACFRRVIHLIAPSFDPVFTAADHVIEF